MYIYGALRKGIYIILCADIYCTSAIGQSTVYLGHQQNKKKGI